ncbi:selenium-binding protein [Lipomyces doorenjongii]
MDPTFYRTAADAIAAPPEKVAYVVAFDRAGQKNDAMTVIDVQPGSKTYGRAMSCVILDEMPVPVPTSTKDTICMAYSDATSLLLVIRSSNIYVFDVGSDPRNPKLVKTIDSKTLSKMASYSRPHTTHCGPDGVFLTCLGGAEGDDDGPGGDLSAAVFRWFSNGDTWKAEKVISIPAEPADPDILPPALKPFGAVPPFITDIDLSVDDKFLYVSCWATGHFKQYDVSDPAHPVEVGSVRIGGIVSRAAHPAKPDMPLAGGPQMVEISRDGKRVYFTNSLYGPWDDQFYPDGVGAWMVKLDVNPTRG